MASKANAPNFLCVGAAKAGTTTLYHLIKQHPQVFVTTPKELNFFSLDERYRRGWDWYQSHFRDVQPHHKAIGEFGVTYTVDRWTETIPRMKSHLPELKIIYMVRDPIARIESQWIESRLGRNRRRHSFAEAVRQPGLIDTNRYWNHYRAYCEAYGESNVLLIFLEKFRDDTAGELRRTFEFLGVDPTFQVSQSNGRFNQSSDKREDTAVLDLGRRFPGFSALRDLIPVSWRARLRSIFKRGEPVEKPIWNRADYEWVCHQLRDDNLRLLRHFGLPDTYWTLQPTHAFAEVIKAR